MNQWIQAIMSIFVDEKFFTNKNNCIIILTRVNSRKNFKSINFISKLKFQKFQKQIITNKEEIDYLEI